MGSFTVPGIHCFFDSLNVFSIFDPYPKKSPHQLGRLTTTVFDLEAILPPEINEGFSADELFRRRQRVIRFKRI